MKEWEWQLANDHIEKINEHRMEILSPWERLCVGQKSSWCYRLRDIWTNLIMSRYVQMDCETNYGWKIQDNLCDKIISMLKLNLVKGKDSDEADIATNRTSPDRDVDHGTKVPK